jgi:ligand-binding SRPBCC domain-containing protein
VPQPLDEVFDFFADARNLEALTPPWLRFEILTPMPIAMRPGARIDYRLRVHGVPLRWRSEITVWEPPHRFVDVQIRGPYRHWHHEHRFAERDGGTAIGDVVDYAVGGLFLEPLLHRFLVAPDVRRIFAYRQARLAQQFGASTYAAQANTVLNPLPKLPKLPKGA